MNERILNILLEVLKDLNEELEKPALENPTPQMYLYAPKGCLDSLALVRLIADVEERVFEVFGKSIILADERAMSQKMSPFRRLETLVNYIETLLEEPL